MKKCFIILFVLSFFITSCFSKPSKKIDNVKIVQKYYDQFYDEIKHNFKKIKAINLIPNKIQNLYQNISPDNEMLVREDFFKNCLEITIKSIFENIKEISSFIYTKDYFPSTEIEPNYQKYLNENYYGKTIRVLSGRKNNKNIVLWLYEENETWKCFSSVEFSDSVEF